MAVNLPIALLALAALQQQTDTTVSVPAGARLRLHVHAGAIRVTTWERGDLRVRAEHGSRDHVVVEVRGTVVRVDARRRMGGPAIVDYDLTVPVGMALDLGGVDTHVTVTGPVGDVSASSVEGDIDVRGVGGAVSVNTVEGDIVVEGGRGSVRATGVDGDVRVANVRGDVVVETVDGDVTLDDIDGGNVDVGSVDGTIEYRGTIRDGGRYRFTSHDGDVILAVPEGINATVSVATFDGSFEADPAFRVQITEARPGKRFSFALGNGSARVELESFDGSIRLVRRNAPGRD
jgi:DUF4097 and DUF4098 domain-containing protein YvlB